MLQASLFLLAQQPPTPRYLEQQITTAAELKRPFSSLQAFSFELSIMVDSKVHLVHQDLLLQQAFWPPLQLQVFLLQLSQHLFKPYVRLLQLQGDLE